MAAHVPGISPRSSLVYSDQRTHGEVYRLSLWLWDRRRLAAGLSSGDVEGSFAECYRKLSKCWLLGSGSFAWRQILAKILHKDGKFPTPDRYFMMVAW